MLSKILSFFIPQTVFQTVSQTHGQIKIVDFFGKRSLQTGDVSQSGFLVEKVWNSGVDALLEKTKNQKIKNVLILGLGCGSLVKILSRKIPHLKITGIEIDPIVIEIGEKYFALKKYENLKVINKDAKDYIETSKNDNHLEPYDAIFVDLYKGKVFPEFLNDEKFLICLTRLIKNDSFIIFNCLVGKNQDFEANIFLDKATRIYHDIFVREVRLSQEVKNLLIFCKIIR